MIFSELHQKLALTYTARISIIYPNALNDNLLSYLFSDELTGNTLTVKIQNNAIQIIECINAEPCTSTVSQDVKAFQELTHDYFFKSK